MALSYSFKNIIKIQYDYYKILTRFFANSVKILFKRKIIRSYRDIWFSSSCSTYILNIIL